MVETAQSERVKVAPKPDPSRLEWVDSAKAISILLVVLWHTVNTKWYFNELLFFLRMPLFFFVAGFFARGAITSSTSKLFKTRVFNFLYLYVLWFLIVFASTTMLQALRNGESVPVPNLLEIFVDPPATLWFIYALAIIYAAAKLLFLVPAKLRILLAFAIYCLSAANGEWGVIAFHDNVMRLMVFFLLGDLAFSTFKTLPQSYDRWSIPLLALFIGLSWTIFELGLETIGPVTFLASAIGITGLILLCRWMNDLAFMTPLKFMGVRTIYVYLMHRIVMVYALAIYTALGWDDTTATRLLTFFIAVPLTLAIGIVLDRHLPILFVAPWNAKEKYRLPTILSRKAAT